MHETRLLGTDGRGRGGSGKNGSARDAVLRIVIVIVIHISESAPGVGFLYLIYCTLPLELDEGKRQSSGVSRYGRHAAHGKGRHACVHSCLKAEKHIFRIL